MVNVMPQQDLWYCWLLIFWCSHWNFSFFQTFRNFVGSFTKPHLISVRLAFPTWPGSNHLEVFSRSATTLGWMHVSRSRIENWAVERWDGHGHGMGCFERRRFAAESMLFPNKSTRSWWIGNCGKEFICEKRSTERTSFWSTYKRACGSAGRIFIPSSLKGSWETVGVQLIDTTESYHVQKVQVEIQSTLPLWTPSKSWDSRP